MVSCRFVKFLMGQKVDLGFVFGCAVGRVFLWMCSGFPFGILWFLDVFR